MQYQVREERRVEMCIEVDCSLRSTSRLFWRIHRTSNLPGVDGYYLPSKVNLPVSKAFSDITLCFQIGKEPPKHQHRLSENPNIIYNTAYGISSLSFVHHRRGVLLLLSSRSAWTIDSFFNLSSETILCSIELGTDSTILFTSQLLVSGNQAWV